MSPRLHLQHGPINLVIDATAEPEARAASFRAAEVRFATVLDVLCTELAALRMPAGIDRPLPRGPVAARMEAAVRPYAQAGFITPMAAVAGAVADEMLAAMLRVGGLRRAFVNNGGDIALYLAPGEVCRIGLIDRPDRPNLFGATTLAAANGVRGVATSGWRGRSFSLGIADAVTVLAACAADADAAATIIANAVDLPGHPAVHRRLAADLQPDNDLGHRLVTRAVDPLSAQEANLALNGGVAMAERLLDAGRVAAVALHCQGHTRIAGRQVFKTNTREAIHA